MQTTNVTRQFIDRAVFSPISDAVLEYEGNEDEVWFMFMAIYDMGNDYEDLLSFIPHIYANSNG